MRWITDCGGVFIPPASPNFQQPRHLHRLPLPSTSQIHPISSSRKASLLARLNPLIMDPVSFAHPPAYMTPARKCPQVDSSSSPSNTASTIPDPTSLLSTPTKELAKLLLEHVSFVEELSPGSPSTREQCILQVARENDIKWKLSPSKTIVQPKPLVRPPVPEVY